MDKLYAIKIRQSDGTYGAAIPVSVLAENVDWNSTLSLVDILGQVDTSESIQDQINNLKNTRATQASVNALDQKVDNAVEYITHNSESYKEIINTVDSTYNISLFGYAVGKTVTISALRENNHVASSGWTTIATIPTTYAPVTNLTIYCTDGASNRLIFRVTVEGKIMIYSIPDQQIACVLTYAIK